MIIDLPARTTPTAIKSVIQAHVASLRAAASDRELTALYATSTTAYAAANFWANNVAAIPLRPHDPQGNPLPPESNHPLARLLYSPRFTDAKRRIVYADLFWGRNLLQKDRNFYGQTIKLTWINPNCYGLDFSIRTGSIEGFYLYPDRYHLGTRTYLERKDGVYFTAFDFEDDFDGVSAAEVAFLQAGTQPEIAQTTLAFFRNMAIPAMILQPTTDEPDERHKTDKDSLTGFLKRAMQGAMNAGRTLVTATRWDVRQLQLPFKDLDMSPLIAEQRLAVCEAFDVSVEFFVTGQTTYAELEGKIQLWQSMRLKPRVQGYADALAQELCAEYPGYTIQPDFSGILKEDEAAKVTLIDQKVKATLLTLYDAQKALGVEQPDTRLQDLYVVEGIPVPAAELGNLWQSRFAAPLPALQFGGIVSTPPQPLLPDTAQSIDEPQAEAGKSSLCIALDLGGDPDLLALQSRLKAHYSDLDAQWHAPDDFHITLLYAPAVTDEQLAQVKAALDVLPVPSLMLAIGSVKPFDALGQFEVQMRIRRNADLLDLQEQLYDLADGLHIASSSRTRPVNFTPHVTFGTASGKPRATTFTGSIKVTPLALLLFEDDDVIARYPVAAESVKHVTGCTCGECVVPALDTPVLPLVEAHVPDAQWSELKSWHAVKARKGRGQVFTFDQLPGVVRGFLALSLEDESAALDDIYADAQTYLKTYKSYAQTRAQFVGELTGILSHWANDDFTRRKLQGQMNSALRRYGLIALRDALTDGGYTEEALPEDALTIFRVWQEQQKDYVRNLANRGALAESLVELRADMWANKSLDDIYYAGLRIAAPSKLGTWRRNPAKDSCVDCIARDGKTMTIDEWGKIGFPRDSRLACHGDNCGCELFDEDNKRIGAR